MRQRITIKTPTLNTDSQGGNVTSWAETDYWCDIDEKPINKTLDNGRTVYGKSYTVTLRNGGIVPDMTLQYRFTYRGNDLGILNEITSKNRAFRVFECEYAN